MAEKTYYQEFEGYWRDQNKGGIPAQSGVYCVYTCTYNVSESTVTLHKLIYIGESVNVRDRIANHEKRANWLKQVGWGQELCFNFTPVPASDRDRVEAAFIHHHKPPENTEYVESFPFDTTHVQVSGKAALLSSSFTVYRAPTRSFSSVFYR